MLTSPEHTPHTLEPTLNGRGDSSAHALFFFEYLLHNTGRRYAVGHVRVDEKNRFCFNCFFHSILTSLLLALPPRPYTSRACSSKRNLRACRGNCHTLFCCNHQPHACTHHYKHNALSLSRKRREPFFFFLSLLLIAMRVSYSRDTKCSLQIPRFELIIFFLTNLHRR